MKKVFFALVATAIFSVNSFAENKNDNKEKEVPSKETTCTVTVTDTYNGAEISVTCVRASCSDAYYCAQAQIGKLKKSLSEVEF